MGPPEPGRVRRGTSERAVVCLRRILNTAVSARIDSRPQEVPMGHETLDSFTSKSPPHLPKVPTPRS